MSPRPKTGYCICLAVVFFLTCNLSAQLKGGIFYHLTIENGLSSNRVNSIIQDHEGLYWIATQDGLNCFDGSACKIFRTIKNDTFSLSNNDCLNLIEDDQGDIWIGTQMGLSRYKRKEGKFGQFFFNNPKYTFEQVNGIRGITKDEEGNIWVCSAGLWQYNIFTHKWKAYLHDPSDPSSMPPGFAAYVQYDKINHGLWMSADGGFAFFDLITHEFHYSGNNPEGWDILDFKESDGIFVLDRENNFWFHNGIANTLCKYSISTNKIQVEIGLANSGLSSLSADNAGRIWMHYWIGNTFTYDIKAGTVDSSFLKYFHPQSPLTLFTRGLYVDRENNYWIFSNEGISIYDPNEQSVHYYLLADQKKMELSLNFAICCFTEQNDSILWVGSNNGLYQYNINQQKGRLIPGIKVGDNFICCVFVQDDSILWVGGHHELIRYDIRKNKILQQIDIISTAQMIIEDRGKNIWLATRAGGLLKFSANGRLLKQIIHGSNTLKTPVSNYIRYLVPAGDKDFAWISYNGGGGFSQFDLDKEIFSNFKIEDSSFNKITSKSVNCITEDKKGNLWLGTYGGGLTFYDRIKKNYITYTESDGLKGNFINGILNDNDSYLWIETTNGLSVMNMNDHSIINSEIDLVQASNDYFPNGLLRGNKNPLFYCNNKIVEFDPDIFLRSTSFSKIVYSSFKVFDKEKILSKTEEGRYELKLPHSQNFFSFEYSLLKPNPQRQAQYAYRLEGFDPGWNYVGERRTAYYTNVPPGHYTFSAKATNETGRWSYLSEPIDITILPPFWKTWWFISAVIFLLISVLYLLYKYRINQLKKLISVRTKISQDLHDDVASTLSGIRLYSEIAKQQLQKADADHVMNSLNIISTNAAEMKKDMSDIIWTINPGNDSLHKLLLKLNSYASGAAVAAGMLCNFFIEENLPEEKLNMQQRRNIYLICKEAINNAIKYSNAKKLEIKVFNEDHSVIFLIKDDGSGFDTQKVTDGNGLINMRMRANEISGNLKIDSENGVGTVVLLNIKL